MNYLYPSTLTYYNPTTKSCFFFWCYYITFLVDALELRSPPFFIIFVHMVLLFYLFLSFSFSHSPSYVKFNCVCRSVKVVTFN